MSSIFPVVAILALCFGIDAFIMTLVFLFDPFDEFQDMEED